MAKLLFFNIPAYGHVNPTLAVVTELMQRGHHVVYYNSETFEPAIKGTGAEFRAYPNSNTSESDLAERINNLVDVTVFILEESIRLLPFSLDTIEQEKPDLVIFDSIALWAMQATRLQNVSSVASISTFVQEGVSGMLEWRDYLNMLQQAFTKLPTLQRLRRQLVKTYGSAIFPGKSILPCKGNFNIVYTSREFQPDTPYIDDSFHFVGPSILMTTRKETDFPWDLLDPERTKIYLSLGTLYSNNLEFYRTVFKAFSDHSAQFILSVGRLTDIHELGLVPDNFIVQLTVPQLELLQKVDLFITHGGMNSVNEGLNYGVPLVVVPQQIEQVLNGRQVARHGAGVVLAGRPPYGRLDAGDLRRTVDKILADPIYRLNAERLSRSFHEAGGYQRAATAIISWLD
ncbi:glycosyl transferase [candidate division KSB1 bacterium]|nr:glycosyl transferase [candidate division KSB1 bacterium]